MLHTLYKNATFKLSFQGPKRGDDLPPSGLSDKDKKAWEKKRLALEKEEIKSAKKVKKKKMNSLDEPFKKFN